MSQKIETRYQCYFCQYEWYIPGDYDSEAPCPKCGAKACSSDKQLAMDFNDEIKNEESHGVQGGAKKA